MFEDKRCNPGSQIVACLGHKDTMAERALFGPGVAQVSHFECSNERLEMKPGGSEASYEQVREPDLRHATLSLVAPT